MVSYLKSGNLSWYAPDGSTFLFYAHAFTCVCYWQVEFTNNYLGAC